MIRFVTRILDSLPFWQFLLVAILTTISIFVLSYIAGWDNTDRINDEIGTAYFCVDDYGHVYCWEK